MATPTMLANMVLLVLVTALFASLLVNPVIGLHTEAKERQIVANVNLSARKLQLKRKLIGSTAPTCTYNECRGCKYRCRAEQIPVDSNDPLNSAYRYKCVCHR
ncbi:unnamed protein product [Amaranthus hypochondriacus]